MTADILLSCVTSSTASLAFSVVPRTGLWELVHLQIMVFGRAVVFRIYAWPICYPLKSRCSSGCRLWFRRSSFKRQSMTGLPKHQVPYCIPVKPSKRFTLPRVSSRRPDGFRFRRLGLLVESRIGIMRFPSPHSLGQYPPSKLAQPPQQSYPGSSEDAWGCDNKRCPTGDGTNCSAGYSSGNGSHSRVLCIADQPPEQEDGDVAERA